MLENKEMIRLIQENEKVEKCQNNNDDHDMGEVLKCCFRGKLQSHELRFSDGKKRTITF